MGLQQIKASAIGVMSGTSLDGLDLAYCTFVYDQKWSFEIVCSTCISYDDKWKNALSEAHLLPAEKLLELDNDFGTFIGEQVSAFLSELSIEKTNLICSHGHTVFHDPSNKYTLQIGSGANICSATRIDTVFDFRSLDVSLGGQGAPLVPIGDELLFPEYAACLNLGGFSNISFKVNDTRVAFDVCPVNMALNHLSQKLGHSFDRNGNLAGRGIVNEELLSTLNDLDIYHAALRVSLAREWFEQSFLPVIDGSSISDFDKLRTVVEHVAVRISNASEKNVASGKLLVTGGGAKNSLLMERIKALSNLDIVIPNVEIVDYKEALIFAFLGVLRVNGINNVLRSVTGATTDSCSGIVHLATDS